MPASPGDDTIDAVSVVITGAGLVTSLGLNVEETWRAPPPKCLQNPLITGAETGRRPVADHRDHSWHTTTVDDRPPRALMLGFL